MAPTSDLKDAWKAKVITLFPNCFPGVLGESLTGKALQEGLWQLEPIDLRLFGEGKHRNVDDTPAGGGAGMVLRADVLGRAIESAQQTAQGHWPHPIPFATWGTLYPSRGTEPGASGRCHPALRSF